MTIAQQGQINLSALNVPNPVIQIVQPQFLYGGASTNVCGHVGTASWGPVNIAQSFGPFSQYQSIFGPTINRTYDMGGQVFLAAAQGSNAVNYGVRVTDGTDVAATSSCNPMVATGTITFSGQPATNDTVTIGTTAVTFKTSGATGNQVNIGATQAASVLALLAFLQASADAQLSQCVYTLTSASVITVSFKIGGTAGNTFALLKTSTNIAVSGATLAGGAATYGMTLAAKYTGSLGNSLKAIVSPGTQASSYKVILSLPGIGTEVFDSIGTGTTGAAAWTAIVAAINSGLSGIRGPSQLAVATVGASTQTPVATTTTNTFSSGADGASSITSGLLIGTDGTGSTRTGMYALRGTNCAQFAISDLSDSTVWSTMDAFGKDIGAVAISQSPSGDTITNAASTLTTAGIDSFGLKIMFGDWIVWFDTYNLVPQRVSGPAGVTLGLLGNLSPQLGTLNKAVNGIVGTQSSAAGRKYTQADFSALANARMDLICVDTQLGSSNFVHRLGINTSSNQITQVDPYPRVTYFLAKSLERIAGNYIGQLQTPTERRQAKTAITEFLGQCQRNGIIGTADGSQSYQVILDGTNNSATSTALGFQYCQVKAQYLSEVRYFVVNLEGGTSVQISTAPTV